MVGRMIIGIEVAHHKGRPRTGLPLLLWGRLRVKLRLSVELAVVQAKAEVKAEVKAKRGTSQSLHPLPEP